MQQLNSTLPLLCLVLTTMSGCLDEDFSEFDLEQEDADGSLVLDEDQRDRLLTALRADKRPLGIADGSSQPQAQVMSVATTDYAPVVRLLAADGVYCSGTAIAHDLIITSARCLKPDGVSAPVESVQVDIAHGDNAGAVGRSSSYFIMGTMAHDIGTWSEYGSPLWAVNDIAMVKFGAGTFNSFYDLHDAKEADESEIEEEPVTIVDFMDGGAIKKAVGDTIMAAVAISNNYYGTITTYNEGTVIPHVEEGVSRLAGGPILMEVDGEQRIVGITGYIIPEGSYWGGTPGLGANSMITKGLYNHVNRWLAEDDPNRLLTVFCAEAYEHGNYGGWAESFCVTNMIELILSFDSFGDPWIIRHHTDHAKWNNEISSIKIPEQMSVTFHDGASYDGSAVTYQNSLPFVSQSEVSSLFPNGFNDKPSSVAVEWNTSGGQYSNWQLELTLHDKCLDVANGGAHNGANLQQWDCLTGQPNQVFTLVPSGDYYMIKHTATGNCVDVSGYGTGNGTNIQMWDCHGGANQLFILSENENATPDDLTDFFIRSKQSLKCLDLDAGGSGNGTNIQLWSCNAGNPNQNFAPRNPAPT